jgi:hypothetical protein
MTYGKGLVNGLLERLGVARSAVVDADAVLGLGEDAVGRPRRQHANHQRGSGPHGCLECAC